MSFTFVSPAISNSFLKVKWREQYGSAGVNKKLYGIISAGIYRGLTLSTSGSNNTVTVVPDSTHQDHLAVYETADGYSVTLRDDTNTTYSLALTDATLLNTTVVVTIFVEYKEGSTTANFIAYTLAEYNALSTDLKKELIVLGTVANPPAGNLITDIRNSRRTLAKPYSPVVRNGGFEHGVTSSNNRYYISAWDNNTATNGRFRLSTSNPETGARCLELNATATSGVSSRIEQYCEIPVVTGRGVRVTASAWQVINSNLGSIYAELIWGDATSTSVATTEVILGLTGSTDTGYRAIDELSVVPAGAYFLKSVAVVSDSSDFNSTGVVFRTDNLQVYLEAPVGVTDPADDCQLTQLQATSLVLQDPAYVIGNLAPLITYDSSSPVGEGKVKLEWQSQATDLMNPAFALYGRLIEVGSRLMSSADETKLPRVDVTYSVNDPTLLFQSTPETPGTKSFRIYSTTAGSTYLTINAYFDGANWIKDVNGAAASAVYLDNGTDAVRFYTQAAAVNTWAAWTTATLALDTKRDVVAVGSTTYTGVADFALSNNVNNADPLGDGTTNGLRVLRVDPTVFTGGWNMNGLVGGVDGREIDIVNSDPALQHFNIVHEATAATAANRFLFPHAMVDEGSGLITDRGIRVYPGGCVRVRYDSSVSRWRVLHMSGCRILKKLVIPATLAQLQSGSGTEPYGNMNITALPTEGGPGHWDMDEDSQLDYPISVPAGAIIDGYTVYLRKNSDGTVVLSSCVGVANGLDGTNGADSPGDSNGASVPGFITLTESSLELFTAVHRQYFVVVTRNPTAGALDLIYHTVVNYWGVV